MAQSLRISSAQLNTTVGDIHGNLQKIIAYTKRAHEHQQADLVVFPETALTGYPVEDLLFTRSLYHQIKDALKQLKKLKDIYILVGTPTKIKGELFNSALLLYNGKILAEYHKQQLPNYGVFDEKRYFTPGTEPCVVTIKGIKLAIAICADIWHPATMRQAKKLGAKLMVTLNASPFEITKATQRQKVLSHQAKLGRMPIIYTNSVGGQDDLVFDGGSCVVNAQGQITQQAPFFKETLMLVELLQHRSLKPTPVKSSKKLNTQALIYQALILAVQDYAAKNGFTKALVSVSGGIDSALTLAIAVDALGSENVAALYLPSRYSSPLSTKLTKQLTKNLKVTLTTIAIDRIVRSYQAQMPKAWYDANSPQIVLENLQARCRANLVMAYSNACNLLVLTTSNKSEAAVGYTTLYGDMAGGFGVLKDLYKTRVYQLAEYRNSLSPVIPKPTLTRPPSAELAPNQKDSDTLPAYPILDEILTRHLELNQEAPTLIAAGFAEPTVRQVLNMVRQSEYKRRQAPPGPKLTSKALGRERRYPISGKY